MKATRQAISTLTVCLAVLVVIEATKYEGLSLIKVTNFDGEIASVQRAIEDIPSQDVTLLPDEHVSDGELSLMVSREQKDALFKTLSEAGMQIEVIVEDVEELMLDERRTAANDCKAKGSSYTGNMSFNAYHGAEVFHEYFDYLASTYDHVSTFSIGRSYEGRDMKILQICKNGPCGSSRYGMWIDAGIHGCEWIGPPTAMYLAQELVENDAAHPDLTENLDWYILPVANPDGYAYTRDPDGFRFWRMTRRPNEGSPCIGTDPNRNWGYMWGPTGNSGDPCDPEQKYRGPHAFSEIEILNIARFINTTTPSRGKGKIVYYQAIHSYMEAILTPWGYTYDDYPYLSDLTNLAEKAVIEMKKVDGRHYVVDTLPNLFGDLQGSSIDWTGGLGGVKYSYGMELRQGPYDGVFGFLLPPEEICPNSKEVFEFHKSIARDIFGEFGLP